MSVSFVWYPAATYFPARGSHSAAWSFSVADAPRTPCLTGSPVRFIVHRTRSQSIPSPALGCLTWPGKYLLIKDQRKTPCAAWCSSLVSGGYLFFRPRLPQCGMVVQRRRRSSNSLPYWISCSLHRPPDALTVDPITSPWLFDLARKIPTHQRPKKNTMQRMVFFFGIRRLPIFPASAHMVAARRDGAASSSSLCLSSSDSLLRPPGALISAVSPAKRKRKPELDSGNSNRCI